MRLEGESTGVVSKPCKDAKCPTNSSIIPGHYDGGRQKEAIDRSVTLDGTYAFRKRRCFFWGIPTPYVCDGNDEKEEIGVPPTKRTHLGHQCGVAS